MQLFLADCQFPDIENQVKAYQLFVEAWENGESAKADKTAFAISPFSQDATNN